MKNIKRILLAKTGLDTHDRGVRLVARGLRDMGGMEVIYTGLYRSLEEITNIALQEDVDVVGLSVHTPNSPEIFRRLRELLTANHAGDILVIGGGAIPEKHREEIVSSGLAAELFGPGTSIQAIVDWLKAALSAGEEKV